jgi:hypothetical protein
MNKKLLLLITVAFFTVAAKAQYSKYIIRFKHKGDNPYALNNPSQYLSARAIARRTRYSIPIDSADLPITPRFLDSIRLAGAVTILNTSKWLNQVAIKTTDAAALAKINSFPFVISATAVAPLVATTTTPVNKKLDAPDQPFGGTSIANGIDGYYSYGQSYGQVHLHNGDFLHNRGFRGQGMQLSVMDAGFYHYLSLPTFDSIRNNGQVLGTWDFVANEASVDEDDSHGMKCLSTIAANIPGSFVGTGPKISFYLFRTEDVSSEYPIEEQNWIAAAERADSLGVDVYSTSLGYFSFDDPSMSHTYAQFDGNTTMIARAADIAAKKGIIAVVAAGNEGSGSWHYIITPADADSVIAVGAVTTDGVVGSFSSYGPSSDGQIKPTMAAVGVNAVVANNATGGPSLGSGTSFACPNMAGLVTCLWQAFPEVNNMTIINTLTQSSTKATTPDDRVGYGIPDMKKAFVRLERQLFTKNFSSANCKTTLQFSAKADSAINVVVERKSGTATGYTLLTTLTSTGGFSLRNFNYVDDMINIAAGPVTYRLTMNVATDTTFYLDSVTVNFTPKPALGADKAAAICSGKTFDLTSQFTTTGLTNAWTLGGNPVAMPAAVSAPGAYQLIAANTSGCADTAVVNLTVNTSPDLGADKAITKCSNTSVNLNTYFVTTGLNTSWTLNGATVTTPTDITAAGVYKLTVTSTASCTDEALLTITNDPILCTQSSANKITISPNPVKDVLFVKITRLTNVTAEVMLTNAAGQKIYYTSAAQTAGERIYQIPMQKLAGGIYFVTVKIDGKKEVVKKIVRQ